jgi:imidazolonepropionase-like amidohydrolase
VRTVLTNCTVIDCTGGKPMKDLTVVIEGDRIAALKPGTHVDKAREEEERVFDLNGGYIIPGLWNVHVHLSNLIPDPRHLIDNESAIDAAVRGGRNAMDALRAGITAMRVLGDRDYIDVAWRHAFGAGVFVGPRLFVSGQYICATGGHAWDSPIAIEVDGPNEMRKIVREQLKHGADWIKLAVTGGIATAGESMQESQFLLEEIEAATKIAHQKRKGVTVHAGGPEGIKTAIRGGVDCIEHGYYADDEAIEMMRENDVFYVPTLNVTQDERSIQDSRLPKFMIEKALASADAHRETFRKALKAGVKIACGADGNPIAEYTPREIECLVKSGLKEIDALIAATKTSAELCRMSDQLGTVEVGKLADLIVLSANPLESISNIRKPKLVLKGGRLVDTGRQEALADFCELFL